MKNIYRPLEELFLTLDWECNKTNLEAMGKALADLVGRPKPYTYRYLRSVLYCNYSPGDPLKKAIELAETVFDGVPLVKAETIQKAIYAHPELDVENAHLITPSKICASPKCNNRFIPNIWNRRYCYLCKPPI